MVEKLVFSPLQENTYIVYEPNSEAAIIDPGCLFQHEKERLKNKIKELGVQVTHLLQTHAHLDHVFGSAYVKRTWDVKMYLHEKELPILQDVPARCNMWGIPGYEPVEPDIFLQEGELISVGKTRLEVVHVPGHAPGHVAFINHKDRYIIGGDCLFKGSIGRTDFPLCSHEDLITSVKTKFFSLPDDYIVYAGHMEETTIGYEKKHNPYF